MLRDTLIHELIHTCGGKEADAYLLEEIITQSHRKYQEEGPEAFLDKNINNNSHPFVPDELEEPDPYLGYGESFLYDSRTGTYYCIDKNQPDGKGKGPLKDSQGNIITMK